MQLLELGSNSAQDAQPVQTRLAWVSSTVKGADRSTDLEEKSRFRPPIFPAYFLIRVGAKRPGWRPSSLKSAQSLSKEGAALLSTELPNARPSPAGDWDEVRASKAIRVIERRTGRPVAPTWPRNYRAQSSLGKKI